ncbi:MAG: hypothetical protein DLM64_14965 [Solirubrobacterales bacterium]|nr:MAG: hypothetical protein DLM64_14965 [Solirubrobacterales bacterium]
MPFALQVAGAGAPIGDRVVSRAHGGNNAGSAVAKPFAEAGDESRVADPFARLEPAADDRFVTPSEASRERDSDALLIRIAPSR